MNKDQALRVVELGKRGCSVDMIKRTLHREKAGAFNSRSIRTVLEGAGLGDYKDSPQEHMEMQKFSNADELRARWDKLLPAMKQKLRASIGGI